MDSPRYSFQQFTLPGQTFTVAYGINDLGAVTGVSGSNGFIESQGSVAPVTIPYTYPVPLAINNIGAVVGEFPKSDGGHAFIDMDGTITYLSNLPQAFVLDARATGINDLGQVVGQFTGTNGAVPPTITAQFGFIDNNGTLTDLTLPGGQTFLPTGINDFDQIVGTTTAGASYVLDLRGGKAVSVNVPDATATDATAINNLGQVAGTYIDSAGSVQAFVDTHGSFNFLQFPPSLNGTLQSVSAINDLGQIVGQYVTPAGTQESFVAAPSGPPFLEGLRQGLAAQAVTWLLDTNNGHVTLPIDPGHY